eukprot:175308-Pyramimonas_sp.AAC.1
MADVEYIGGGIAISKRHLDEDLPASPAPGTVIIPPYVLDDRFCNRQQGASYNCDGCTNTGMQGTPGTWEDDDTRELLAQNRAQAYTRGKNC